MPVRAATMSDLEELLQIVKDFYYSSPYKDQPVSDEKFSTLLRHFITPQPFEHMAFVYERDGELTGALIGQATTGDHLFSENKVASEVMWYVKPDSRGGMAPIRLLFAYEDWAELAGCKKISMGLMAGDQRESITKMYRRMGYTSVEETFLRDI